MNELKIFENSSFGKIRTIVLDNEPWFIGKDVADALGYRDYRHAVRDHVQSDDKQIFKGGETPLMKIPNYGITLINESGLYSLIFSSKMERAKEFKHWVTSEVLPSIRKNGSYAINPESTDIPPITALNGVANFLNITRKIMRDQGSNPSKIALQAEMIFKEYKIPIINNFIEKTYEQVVIENSLDNI